MIDTEVVYCDDNLRRLAMLPANGVYHYVEWMRERVMEMWRVLAPGGSLYLHCGSGLRALRTSSAG